MHQLCVNIGHKMSFLQTTTFYWQTLLNIIFLLGLPADFVAEFPASPLPDVLIVFLFIKHLGNRKCK
jgi:hypothetical protein